MNKMQCQICQKRTATIHLTELSQGARTELHICEHCAAEQGIATQSQISINELLSHLLAVQPSDEEMFGPAEKERACPTCGFTLDRLRKEGTLGCPADYEVFEQALLPLIERAHGGHTSHCGKVPTRLPTDTKKFVALSHLRRQLEEAVRDEDYERAARLRDQMKQLEQGARQR
jgi:protein arginine kinase activator